MFNTEINHFLQLFNYPIVYWILNIVSMLGSLYYIIFILFSLIGGVNFRKGFLVAYIFGWTILLTVVLKNYIDYPRPLAVDSTLNSFGEKKVETNIAPIQPTGFFELFSDELLSKIRASDIERTGFPSGHTSSQVAIWIGIALLIRKRWLWVFSISFVILTMISRLFLAKHYLGDVLGGFRLGLSIVGIIYFFIKLLRFLEDDHLNIKQTIFFLIPLILIPFYKYLPSFQAGTIIGFCLAYIFIVKRIGNPILNNSILKRIITILIFFITFVLFYFFGKILHLSDDSFWALIVFILFGFLSILIATTLNKLLKLIEIKK